MSTCIGLDSRTDLMKSPCLVLQLIGPHRNMRTHKYMLLGRKAGKRRQEEVISNLRVIPTLHKTHYEVFSVFTNNRFSDKIVT